MSKNYIIENIIITDEQNILDYNNYLLGKITARDIRLTGNKFIEIRLKTKDGIDPKVILKELGLYDRR